MCINVTEAELNIYFHKFKPKAIIFCIVMKYMNKKKERKNQYTKFVVAYTFIYTI